MISLVLVSTSGACSTARTCSTGMSRSRSLRITWATATWRGVVKAVAGSRVDPGCMKQPLILIEAQRLDAQMRHAGEIAD